MGFVSTSVRAVVTLKPCCDLSEEDSNSVSLGEKAVRRSPLMKRGRRKSKN